MTDAQSTERVEFWCKTAQCRVITFLAHFTTLGSSVESCPGCTAKSSYRAEGF